MTNKEYLMNDDIRIARFLINNEGNTEMIDQWYCDTQCPNRNHKPCEECVIGNYAEPETPIVKWLNSERKADF